MLWYVLLSSRLKTSK